MRRNAPRQISFAEAVREGLDQAMQGDDRVLVIGEGVPDPKAIFGTTRGLKEKYGTARVFDMPLSENGMTGICIGAALAGLRPVMVHQRIDFALLAMDQLVNNAAKWHYMFNGKASVPLVVRVIVGRGWGQGPQHSQSLQAMFAQVPGLKVVMPTTPYDAKGMLVSAIEDDNPVVFIEHRWLHNIQDVVPEEIYRVPLDRANILQRGDAVTIAAFSYMVVEALIAAKALANESINVEIIDMRSARPLDVETVIESVRKTGRLLVADTAFETGGVAGELVCQVVNAEWRSLKVAPERLAAPDYPVPTSPFLAEGYYPSAQDVVTAVFRLLGPPKELESNLSTIVESVRPPMPLDVPNKSFQGPF